MYLNKIQNINLIEQFMQSDTYVNPPHFDFNFDDVDENDYSYSMI